MFGNLKVPVCGLEDGERELYKAAFCTVCHDLRAASGLLSTLLTNYDSTFWLVLAQGLYSQRRPEFHKRPCNGFPLKSVTTLNLPESLSRTNTAFLWLLAEAKASDDVGDEGSLKASVFLRLGAKTIEGFTRFLAEDGFPVACLKHLPEYQSKAESSDQKEVRTVAAPTMIALGEIFGHIALLCQQPAWKSTLIQFGQQLGLAIFLVDSLEDRKADRRQGRFNASLHCHDFSHDIFGRASDELSGLLRQLPLTSEARSVLSKALAKLRSKYHGLARGKPARVAVRPLRRLRKAGFFLNPLADKRTCWERYCECNPCEGCCEGCQCCGDAGDCCSGCDCNGCDCGGCDCGCAC